LAVDAIHDELGVLLKQVEQRLARRGLKVGNRRAGILLDVLPEPLGPMTAAIAPARTVISPPRKAWVFPKDFRRHTARRKGTLHFDTVSVHVLIVDSKSGSAGVEGVASG